MTGTRDRNLPANLKLKAPGPAYDQEEMRQAFRALEQHYHIQLISGATGSDFATVLLPLDNGLDALVDAQFVTAPITFDYEIIGYRLVEDCGFSGSVELRVDYATNTDFPTFTEISGSERPTLSSAREEERQTLTTWTTSGVSYSQVRATVMGDATDVTRVVLALALRKV